MKRLGLHKMARQVHAWCGVVLSALLLVLAVSGSLLVLKTPYLMLTVPEARLSPDLSADGLADVTAAAESLFGPEAVSALVYATPDMGLHKVYLRDGGAAYLDRDGALVAQWTKNGRFEDWLFDLHHHLLAGEVGEKVIGVAGLAAILMIISGLIAYWPARRGFRRGLKITSAKRPEILSLHRNLGIYAAVPLMILLLSGIAMTFPQTARTLFDLAGGPRPGEIAEVARGKTDWTHAVATAQGAFPEATPRIAIWPRDDGPATMRLRQPGEWHPNGRTIAAIDPSAGELAGTEDAMEQGLGRRAYNAMYPIHSAHVGGVIYDVVVFLSGLAMSVLVLLGVFAFARRTRVHRRQTETASKSWAA